MKAQRAWWMPRRLTFWDIIVIAVGAAIVCASMSFVVYRGPAYGLPDKDSLLLTSGRVAYAGYAKAGRSGHYAIFRLANSPVVFKFTGTQGDYIEVENALCNGCEASVWSDPNDRNDRLFAWQIEVNGKMIARYSDVKAHWLTDRRGANWGAPIAGVISAGFVALAFRRRRRDMQGRNHHRS